jgi:hypothetical protein
VGIVINFTDLSERRSAERARQHFQETIIGDHRPDATPLDTTADLVYRNLLAQIVGNAQLAALEITDGVEMQGVPPLLEQLRVSVERSSRLLEHLIEHSTDVRGDRGRPN